MTAVHASPVWLCSLCFVWLLHNLVGASFDLFRHLLRGDQLKPWELQPLVSYTSCINALNVVQLLDICHYEVLMMGHGDIRRKRETFFLCPLSALEKSVS